MPLPNSLTRLATIVVALALALFYAPFALAKEAPLVRTQTHVDSPHAVWKDGNFKLMSNSAGLVPIEDTINWVSHGRVDGGLGAYAWRVPDDPRFEFLNAEKNQLMYYGGPAVGFPKNTMPIWAGFGAAADLPTDQFRDKSFNMEIVDFKGPGRMELFTYSDENYPLNRLWSSHDPGFRTTWVNAGTHTHNATTFTRPGHYEVTYRASARKKDGTFIHSEPQTLVWQVGGTNPAERTITDLEAAFNDAKSEGSAGEDSESNTPMFKMAPSTADTKGAKEGILTTLSLDTGNAKDSGRAVFTINGHYLAERKVEGGKASWDEMIGDEESNFQAIFIPDNNSPSPRWVSEPIKFWTSTDGEKDGKDAEAYTTKSGELPTPEMEELEPFETDPLEITSPNITVSTSKVYGEDDRNIDITVAPEDDRTTVRVTGGFYKVNGEPMTSLPQNAVADCEIGFTSGPGLRTSKQLIEGCKQPGYQLMLRIVPDSRSNAGGATLFSHTHKDAYKPVAETTVSFPEASASGDAPEQEGSEKPEDSNAPEKPQDSEEAEESEGSAPTEESSPEAPSTTPKPSVPSVPKPKPQGPKDKDAPNKELNLHRGHVDIAPIHEDGELHLGIKDETNLYHIGAIWRKPSDVFFSVPKQVKTTLDKDIPHFGKKGSAAYVLPETQRTGVVWPGISTEDAYQDTKKNYTFTFTPVKAPKDGEWLAYLADQTGLDQRLAGSDGTHSYTTEGPDHMHLNWAFNKPGTYEVGVTVAEKDGKTAKKAVLRFKVASEDSSSATPPTKGNDNASEGGSNDSTDGTTENDAGSSADNGTESTAPSKERNPETTEPAPSATPSQKREITKGHIDFGPKVVDNKLGFYVNEDDRHNVPEDVALRVHDTQRVPVADSLAKTLSFTGMVKTGSTIYHLPLQQDHNAVWPGWDTIKVGQDYRDAAIEVRPKSAPTDGKWWAGHTASLNTPERTLADSNGTHTIKGVEDGPFHVHAHWIFTEPGRYEMDMRAVNHNGDKLTDWHTVTFLVGDSTTQPGGKGAAEEGDKEEGKPADSSKNKQPGATKPDNGPNSTGTTKPGSDKSKASNSSGSNAGAKAAKGNSAGKSEGSSKSTTAKGATNGGSGPGSGSGGGSSNSHKGSLASTGANVGWVLVLAAVFIGAGIALMKKRSKNSQ
ncbi:MULTISPECIES: choice-of-anchor M domain-containing protein [unclassified Corynebacterium]|uniref:choice-of-anchor M domain-containing protein n=1 Tax=Corynebacterium TaxID=1716 RepID=UPI002550B0FD|nr:MULTISPECIES: choice-of-anchor M domain-containing protein [unclassified Corynebacterium]MDK8451674.1 choice-of-anchor M domain-containing protein [Corynebacterium sp. MSK084]MDK8466182.1 choice-of-anchor M domain-containing protein [Corynebacterium sp. MSK130]MDK8513610.1 choice-of-anchor M domain-containing protein [Corynebacterium sp. MSK123]MDK8547014.1 choice-of-anchor M domain-containing protein [Corynebacterium sp. MSK222]MDK8646892.1 choice-of-anchor M domain-containing protein [Cor